MAWPRYESLSPGAISLTHLKYFLTDKRSLKTSGLLVLLIAIYILGTQIPNPLANTQRLHLVIAQLPLLAVINGFFTGGALGNLAPFTLGILTLLLPPLKTVVIGGGSSRESTSLAWRSIIALVALNLVAVTWLLLLKIIPATFLSFVAMAVYLLLGAIIVFYIERFLETHWGPGIIALNALIVGSGYVQKLLTDRYLLDAAIGVLLIAFVVSFGVLLRGVDEVQLLNIGDVEKPKGTLPVSATNNALQMSFLIFTLVLIVCVVPLLDLFTSLKLSPFGNTLPEIVVFILIQLVVILLFFAVKIIDEVFNTFNSAALAGRLQLDNWIIPDVEVGKPTEIYLRNRIARAHRPTYLFYLAWTLLFSGMMLISQFTHEPITPLPFGVVVFLIILTLCAQVLYAVVRAIRAYLVRVNYREFWATLVSPSVHFSVEFTAESSSIREFIATLPGLMLEEKQALMDIYETWELGVFSLKDFLRLLEVLRAVIVRARSAQVTVTVPQILLKLAVSLILTLVLTTLTLLLVQVFYAPALGDVTFKASILVGVVALFVSLAAAWGVLQDVTALVTQHKV